MNINLAGIETMIRSYDKSLTAKSQELHRVALGEIVVRDREFHLEQLGKEVTRIQGVIQGLNLARQEIQAQLEGFTYGPATEREVVEDLVIR